LRASGRLKAMLARRPRTRVFLLEHRSTLANPAGAAGKIAGFLGGGLDVGKMALAVHRNLYRRRAAPEYGRNS
jgi:hypothetical protein